MATETKKHNHWYFHRMKITLSPTYRICFGQNTYFIGIEAVDLVRPQPHITNMISYHKYICAN